MTCGCKASNELSFLTEHMRAKPCFLRCQDPGKGLRPFQNRKKTRNNGQLNPARSSVNISPSSPYTFSLKTIYDF